MNTNQIKTITVIGSGLIGCSVAMEFALAGYEVCLNSRSQSSLDKGMEKINYTLDELTGLGVITREDAIDAPTRITLQADLKSSIRDADVVIENVYEDLDLKQQIFCQLDKWTPTDTILVSGTSTFKLSDLASVTNRPDKILLANYANPPHLIPSVEIMRNQNTSEDTVNTIYGLLHKIGKRPVVIQQEVPGFVANRLQMALTREALSLVESGVVTHEDIDTIIKNGIGRRWAVAGVFEIWELAGWDLIKEMASWIYNDLDISHSPQTILLDKVDSGNLGVKSGKGFYDWTNKSSANLKSRITHALLEIDKWPECE